MKTNIPTELIQFFQEKPGYLKKSARYVSEKLGYPQDEVVKAIRYIRWGIDPAEQVVHTKTEVYEVYNENTSNIKEFDMHLEKLGIAEEDVKSVKYWQTQKGDIRFSVVTKNDENKLPDLEDVLKAVRENVVPLPVRERRKDLWDKDWVYPTLIVYLSDKHIGATVAEDALYENTYNESVLEERFYRVVDEIVNVNMLYGGISHLVIVDLGDALDGYNAQTTRGGHKLPQNMTNKEAFNTFLRLHKKMYTHLVEINIADRIDFLHITESNHGGEFEYFATRALEEYMNTLYEHNPQVEFHTLTKFINCFRVAGNTLLLTHGKDSEDMRNGLPLTLDAKTSEYITNYVIEQGILFENLHFIKGDLHQASTQQDRYFRYRNIPSMFGSSKWIMTNYGKTRAGCGFDLIEGQGVSSNLKQWEIWF